MLPGYWHGANSLVAFALAFLLGHSFLQTVLADLPQPQLLWEVHAGLVSGTKELVFAVHSGSTGSCFLDLSLFSNDQTLSPGAR